MLWITAPAGTGKTTLFKLLTKELTATSGSIQLDNNDSDNKRRYRRRIGMIMENDLFLTERTIRDNIYISSLIATKSPVKSKRLTKQALNRVNLTGKANLQTYQLSSREKRFLSLARAIAQNPILILADLSQADLEEDIFLNNLTDAAIYGCAVVIFSPQKIGNGRELQLRGVQQ